MFLLYTSHALVAYDYVRRNGLIPLRSEVIINEDVSLLEEADEEVMSALEEAFSAVAINQTKDAESERDAMWDAAFWSEIEQNLGGETPTRLRHFFLSHRVLSFKLTGFRNHTELALRRKNGPTLLTNPGCLALFAYPGLSTGPLLDPKELHLDVNGLRAAAQTVMSDILAAFSDLSYNERRRQLLFPSEFPMNNELAVSANKAETASDYFKTASGEFDELKDDRIWYQPGEPAQTDASIQASFDALDRFDDVDEEALEIRSRQREGIAQEKEFDEFDDDIFGDIDDVFGDFREEQAPAVEEVYSAPSSQDDPTPYGTTRIILSSYFRHDQLALETFAHLLKNYLPPSPRHAYLLRLEANQRPPLASALHGYLSTLYIKINDDNPNAGIRVLRDLSYNNQDIDYISSNDPILLHGTTLNAPYNDDPDRDAIWLVLDYWHPDLSTAEINALKHFLLLDEQFVLRRFAPQDVLPIILDDSPAPPNPENFLDDDVVDDSNSNDSSTTSKRRS
eukprot:CAMPEP_0197313372 /NCGR_PEP_ID=MMETSP0891-20130614/27168_1 /TAXON_ID=44058 ORGANISM="Aureoumbra lagunensis, Strain CCMP1510" /NCGR_SAMPLE_ID=MMETSP0891 /ASSEMBLY_ACC=CAM_ASM_000534 /LENGTH=508 /DNA_ID=CAMNT_0042801165 /DNA_START=1 /DNA_END=1527 /DNA_ORIENTATION=+